jgi:hypothetical protein
MTASHAASTATYDPKIRFVEDYWPLLLSVGPRVWDERTVADMAAGYERYFERGERYALISGSPRESSIGARERKLITDWTNLPRVRERSGALCVGSATIVRNALSRGALTAILWIWKPASPHLAAATSDEAIDYCLGQLSSAGVRLNGAPESIRRGAQRVLDVG